MISKIKLYHVASYKTMLSFTVALFLLFSFNYHATTTYRTDPADKNAINNSRFSMVSTTDTIRKNPIDIDNNYPGGVAALRLFLKENYKYPVGTTTIGIKDSITIDVVVSAKGKIKDTKIISGINEVWDKEALRVIGLMPDWKPAIENRNSVEAEYLFTIKFHPPVASSSVSDNNSQWEIDIKQNPEFPGGYNALLRFLWANMYYPTEAQESNMQGTVIVKFIVESSGKLTDIKIKRGLGKSLDDESIRTVSIMPKWIPGRKNGIPVRTSFEVPIKFQLQFN